jgi:hypothetical protein
MIEVVAGGAVASTKVASTKGSQQPNLLQLIAIDNSSLHTHSILLSVTPR